MKKIRIKDLMISESYQRTVKRGVVNSIKRNYEPRALTPIVVAQRNDGTCWVIDGQQRVTACREMGLEYIPCVVYESTGSSCEARLFRLINGGRKNITRNELFSAALEEGDEQSLAIVACVERCGFVLKMNSGSNAPKNVIRNAAPLETITECGGIGLLEKTLNAIAAAWEFEQGSTKSFVITGVSRFFRRYPTADYERTVECLSRMSPNTLLRFAIDAKELLGGNRDNAVCRVIATQYNKRLAAKNRLEIEA